MPSVIYVHSDGATLTPVRPVDIKALAKLPIGKPLRNSITRPRNGKVHRLYFAAIAAAAKHWPEGAEPEPEGDADLLRAWLQCKAGYARRRFFPVAAKDAVIALIQDIRGDDKYAFVKEVQVDGEPGLVVFIPMSIDYGTLDEKEFEPIKQPVFEIIESMMECSVKELVEADDNET